MRVKHILVSRVAIKWRHNETGLSWDNWVKNSFSLYDTYCRPSLRNQTDQDFTLLSLIDHEVSEYGDVLENEVVVSVGSNGDVRQRIINAINSYVQEIENDYDFIILTRIDRDDCLRKDFVGVVKNHVLSNEVREQYVDLYFSYTYDVKNKVIHNSNKYYKVVSPFVSTVERINDGKIPCIPFMVDHGYVPTKLNGTKLNNLVAIQVIHDTNLSNRIVGEAININLKDFNL